MFNQGIDWGASPLQMLGGGSTMAAGNMPNSIGDLTRALAAGNAIATPGQPSNGNALIAEFLDGTLKSQTYRARMEAILWSMIAKQRAYSVAAQYNRLDRHGGDGATGFFLEGGLPDEFTSEYSRQVAFVRYLGEVGRVTHPMAQLPVTGHSGISTAVKNETVSRTGSLLKKVEQALFYADSTLSPEQFDGMLRQMLAGGTPVVDCGGGPLTEAYINGAAEIVRSAPNYGRITDIFCSIGAHADHATLYLDRLREQFGGQLVGGVAVDEVMTQSAGKVRIRENAFIREGSIPYATGAGVKSKRPAAPTIVAQPTSPAHSGSKFKAAHAGAYVYSFAAANDSGISAPITSDAVNIDAGDVGQITIQTDEDARWIVVYRSEKDGAASTVRQMLRIPRTGSQQVVVDDNDILPGTSYAFGLQFTPDVICVKQLLPLMRFPLAQLDTSLRFALLIYITVLLMAPRKAVLFKNVGRATNVPLIQNPIAGFE